MSFPLCLHFHSSSGVWAGWEGYPRHSQVPWLEHSPSASSVSCRIPEPQMVPIHRNSPDCLDSSLETSLPSLVSLQSVSWEPWGTNCVCQELLHFETPSLAAGMSQRGSNWPASVLSSSRLDFCNYPLKNSMPNWWLGWGHTQINIPDEEKGCSTLSTAFFISLTCKVNLGITAAQTKPLAHLIPSNTRTRESLKKKEN